MNDERKKIERNEKVYQPHQKISKTRNGKNIIICYSQCYWSTYQYNFTEIVAAQRWLAPSKWEKIAQRCGMYVCVCVCVHLFRSHFHFYGTQEYIKPNCVIYFTIYFHSIGVCLSFHNHIYFVWLFSSYFMLSLSFSLFVCLAKSQPQFSSRPSDTIHMKKIY